MKKVAVFIVVILLLYLALTMWLEACRDVLPYKWGVASLVIPGWTFIWVLIKAQNWLANRIKCLVILSLFSLQLATPVAAQIHQAGQTTLEISGGLVDGFKLPGQDNFGTFGSFSYSKYRTLNSYWKGTVHLNQKFYAYDKTMVPVSQWLGEATYFTRVIGLINKSWVINAGGGIAGGYESINQDRGEIKGASIMNQSQWVLGPTLAIEGEYILTGRTILIARVQEYYLFRSNIIPTHLNVGVGVKFILDTDSDYK